MQPPTNAKWIIVTGGVVSGLGKGTAAASIARLVKDGRKIITIKCDGYLNVDPGTMNPTEHGEVFVLDDGGEVDMDFGHYERFVDIDCKFEWSLTSGKIFNSVIERERRGDYLGKTIQIYPHITDEIKRKWFDLAKKESADIVMIEIGGTVGDVENAWFVEAARQLKQEVGEKNIFYAHLTYVPFLSSVGEPKTKPAQRDVALLRENGINPDVIIARSEDPLPEKIKEKLALFCNVDSQHIISAYDTKNIYEIPLTFLKQGLGLTVTEKFGFEKPDMLVWKELVDKINNPKNLLNIAICGKYTDLKDSYASVIEALTHAGAHLDAGIYIKWVETTDIENGKLSPKDALEGMNGVIVPGGFGARGVEGKIEIIRYCRENNVPFLGICYGLQLATVEFARDVCGLKEAHTTECDASAKYPVIDILPEQKTVDKKGATMRLGSWKALLKQGTLVHSLYGSNEAHERHRHRYEVNPDYHKILSEKGLVFSGTSESGRLVEFIEIPGHKYFAATQAHPELKSRLTRPAPLFYGFVKACLS
jgi:CTP synthase